MAVTMNNVKLKQLILKILKADDRLWNEDKTELNQTLLLDLVENIDEMVINLLLQEKDLKDKFFVKIKDVFVFNTNDFRFFMEENKVDNSYTAYKNRIGLTDSKKFLKDTNDVVLDFPYKDCVLEGGQSTEEGTDIYFEYSEKAETYEEKHGKRKEIFFNSVLAYDEIDRLFDHKALTNWKRYTKDGEQEVKEIKRDKDGTIKENLIIKGNNLLALHSLKKQFTGKVKLIYIDPPYYFEEIKKEDTFSYNSNFKLSTWLSFMKSRLEVSRELLRDDGAIFVQINDAGMPHLKLLLDDVFKKENYRNNIIWRKLLSAKKQSSNLSNITENILLYSKSNQFHLNKLFLKTEESKDFKNYPYIEKETGRRYGSFDFTQKGKGESKIFNGKELTPPKGKHWIWDQNRVNEGIKNNLIIFTKNGIPRVKRYLDEKEGNPLSDLWVDEEVKIISANDKERAEFNGQKPESLLKRILDISTKNHDIVIDYHAGTGTTGAVAHKTNRQYILIEQMDYIHDLPEARLKNVINGDKTGVSELVDWKGGGDFIYLELAKWNETAKEKIQEAKSLKELETFFDKMYEIFFLNYNLKIKEFREKVIKEEDFKNLSLEEQKKMFVAMLDNNQMYVNKTEMSDKKFGIDKQDQKLTSEFYNSEK